MPALLFHTLHLKNHGCRTQIFAETKADLGPISLTQSCALSYKGPNFEFGCCKTKNYLN
jgi:hypothetical protein